MLGLSNENNTVSNCSETEKVKLNLKKIRTLVKGALKELK